jgi:TRAP-type C4-dicarboxylate transport system permease small subunit
MFYLGQTSAALEIPLGYVYMVLPLSGLFIVYFAIDNSIPEIKKIWK